MSNLNMITPLTVQGIINKFCYTIGMLPTSYKDSLTYEEQIMAIGHYLETTVYPAINNNAQALTELQTLFTDLYNYVHDYFDNLDVTEEINNKLDEMAESGTLGTYFQRYVQPTLDEQNETISNFQTDVNANITNFETEINTDVQELTDRIDGLASGSPAGVYATLTALQTADPSHSRIYVVSEDGKWYYYDTTLTSWTAGGTYQSTEIAQRAVKYPNLELALQSQLKPSELFNSSEETLSGKYYTGTAGQTITEGTSVNFIGGVMSVQAGDTIIIPFVDRGNWSTIKPIYMTDENDVILYSIDLDLIRNTVTYLSNNFTFTVPEDVTKIYFNNCIQSSSDLRWYPFRIFGYNYFDERLTNQLQSKEDVEVEDTISGVYSNYYWGDSVGNYETRVYHVYPNDKINVISTLAASYTLLVGVFVDNTGKPVGYIGPSGGSSNQSINTDVIVPAQASYLYISVQPAITTKVSKYVFSEVEPLKNVEASYSSGILTLTNHYNDNYIVFKHFGANNLFGLQAYKVGETTYSSSTDMTPAPYQIEAVENGNGDRQTLGFTGGCHGYDNTIYATSNSTASEYSLHIYGDGTEITSGTHYCNEIKIVVVNNIQASNTCLAEGTGRSVLQEKLIYTFDGTTLKLINTITPLEAIKIYRYYGVQLAGVSNSSYKVFADKLYDNSSQADVPQKPDLIVGGVLGARMKSSGIGDYRYNNAQKVYISDNKAYYAPIRSNTPYNITTNDVLYFEGEYIIGSDQA